MDRKHAMFVAGNLFIYTTAIMSTQLYEGNNNSFGFIPGGNYNLVRAADKFIFLDSERIILP